MIAERNFDYVFIVPKIKESKMKSWDGNVISLTFMLSWLISHMNKTIRDKMKVWFLLQRNKVRVPNQSKLSNQRS